VKYPTCPSICSVSTASSPCDSPCSVASSAESIASSAESTSSKRTLPWKSNKRRGSQSRVVPEVPTSNPTSPYLECTTFEYFSQYYSECNVEDCTELATMTYQFCQSLGFSDPKGCRLIMKIAKMLRHCDVPLENVENTLAIALSNLRKTLSSNTTESVMIAVLELYIAHSFIEDVAIQSKPWTDLFLAGYCTHPIMEKAMFQLLRLRDYKVRPSPNELTECLQILTCPVM
jgi:hypothetical protein